MDITSFIRELIVLNECVILRGIGGFETSYKHATLDKDRKTINPPSKKVHFRSDLVKDNGVLMSYIAESIEISKGKASSYIDDFVRRFFDDMKEKGKVFLDGIGEFCFDSKNNIIFSEIENENYLAESFGLEPLEFSTGINEEVSSPGSKKTSKGSKKRKHTGWYVAIGSLLLLVVLTTLFLIATSNQVHLIHWFDNKSVDEKNETMVFGNTDKALEDSIIRAIEKSLNESTIPKKALAVTQQESSATQESAIKTKVIASKPNYYLIAGSFKSRKNAEIMISQLKRKGYTPEIMISGGQFRIEIGSFYNRKEAITELRRIRRQVDQSVWLLEKNSVCP